MKLITTYIKKENGAEIKKLYYRMTLAEVEAYARLLDDKWRHDATLALFTPFLEYKKNISALRAVLKLRGED
jgi:hypothetical protein